MVQRVTKWTVVWGTTYNVVVECLGVSRKVLRRTTDDLHKAEDRIVKLKNSLRHEEQKRNEAVEQEQEANKRADKQTQLSDDNYHKWQITDEELKALKKKLSDNAIPTRDQRSGRYKKRA